MTDQRDSGISLKDDIASIRTDPTFHDVVLVCADGVEIGACRAILASRSVVFKAMFYGNMQEAFSGKVSLHDIKSAAMHAVLRFIHTEEIDLNTISITVEIYHAASFFLLPKLMQLVLNRVYDIRDLGIAVSLLNNAAELIPWNNDSKELYDSVFKPFCANSLAVVALNELSNQALELLLAYTNTIYFKTSEYDLLLCVIEWVWAHDTTAPPAAERRAIFDNINSLSTELIKIYLQNEASRTSLLVLLDYFDLTLVCPHRLRCLINSINVFEDLPQYMWAFCYYACENTKCKPAHPSRFRGLESLPWEWDQSDLMSGLVFSKQGTIVEYPITPNTGAFKIVKARAPTKCLDRNGICKWTIVFEFLSLQQNLRDVGFVEEFGDSSRNLCIGKWSGYMDDKTSIEKGDIVTFYPDLNNRTCALSINGQAKIAHCDLPHNVVNLYPAVKLFRGNTCRFKPCE